MTTAAFGVPENPFVSIFLRKWQFWDVFNLSALVIAAEVIYDSQKSIEKCLKCHFEQFSLCKRCHANFDRGSQEVGCS